MTIMINKTTSRFFMALCKKGFHSFLIFGVYEANNVVHLLSRVGKYGMGGNSLFDMCIGVNAILRDEGITKSSLLQTPISYQAFDIRYEQYCQYIQMLEALQTEKNRYNCFKPLDDDEEDDLVILEQTSKRRFAPRENMDNLVQRAGRLSIGNTCRHTAVELIVAVEQLPLASFSSSISTVYFSGLPCTTELKYGIPSQDIPFYVMPVPPVCFKIDDERMVIAKKLYKRMEAMLAIDPHSLATQKKFTNVKDLYERVVGSQTELDLDGLLHTIQHWKEQNQADLSVLRNTYFWDFFMHRKSATMCLVNEIENDLQNTLG